MPNKHSTLLIVLVSGPICSGKSALVKQLTERHGATVLKTKDIILQHLPNTKLNRKSFQSAGQRLDNKDDGLWVSTALQKLIDEGTVDGTPTGLFVVDSVRIHGQIDALRKAYGADVHHIHLTASTDELQRRFDSRARDDDDSIDYHDLNRNRTEKQIDNLRKFADIVVATDRCSEEAVLVRATAFLNLYPRSSEACATIILAG